MSLTSVSTLCPFSSTAAPDWKAPFVAELELEADDCDASERAKDSNSLMQLLAVWSAVLKSPSWESDGVSRVGVQVGNRAHYDLHLFR